MTQDSSGTASSRRLLVYGANELAWTIADLARQAGHSFCGFIGDRRSGDGIVGGLDEALGRFPDCGVAIGIGHADLGACWRAWQRLRAAGRAVPALVHPRAIVAASAELGPGCVVMAGAIVDERARLDEAVLVWPGAYVGHDSDIGANCSICPHATICGFVEIGAGSFVGASASVADRCTVPAGSFLKMQARYTARRTPAS